MDGEIRESLICAGEGAAPDEVGGEHAVAALAWHVVGSVGCEVQLAPQEPASASGVDDRSTDDGSMLVPVAGEEVLLKFCPHRLREPEAERAAHCAHSHWRTFATLRAAVSIAELRRLLRLDS